jgi:hypothetical protein
MISILSMFALQVTDSNLFFDTNHNASNHIVVHKDRNTTGRQDSDQIIWMAKLTWNGAYCKRWDTLTGVAWETLSDDTIYASLYFRQTGKIDSAKFSCIT